LEKLTKQQMIERLSKFRAASDKINDDLNDLSEKILSIYQLVVAKPELTHEEEVIVGNLRGLIDPILKTIVDSQKYNESLLKNYTPVIKALGASHDVKNNAD